MEKITVLDIKPVEGKPQLRAFAEISIENELNISGVRLMEDNKGYWVGFPQNKYELNGQTKYTPYIKPSERLKNLIREAVLKVYQ